MSRTNNHDSQETSADPDNQVANYNLAINRTTATDVDSGKSAGLSENDE